MVYYFDKNKHPGVGLKTKKGKLLYYFLMFQKIVFFPATLKAIVYTYTVL